MIKLIILLLFLLKTSHTFWPPSYQVHLNQSETFIISDIFDDEDSDDFSPEEEEIIKEENVEQKNKMAGKFIRIRNFVARRNRAAEAKESNIVTEKPPEVPYEKQDYAEYAGFFNNNSQLDGGEKIYYANEKVKKIMENKIKKMGGNKFNSKSKDNDEMYDYEQLKKEYIDLLEKEKKSQNVLKYVTIPEEESIVDSAKNILTVKKPINCTKEEMKGIGFNAARCFIQDLRHPKDVKNKQFFMKRLLIFVIIWFVIYVCIAVPCWCMKGWCCCCFRCKFCNPQERIRLVKEYVVNNPLGVWHTEDGTVVEYEPTEYEEFAQKRLENALMKL